LLAKAGMVATWGLMAGQASEWMGGVMPMPALPVAWFPQMLAGLVALIRR
jgi:hypothetical protein